MTRDMDRKKNIEGTVTSSGRVSRPPSRYVPTEIPEDDDDLSESDTNDCSDSDFGDGNEGVDEEEEQVEWEEISDNDNDQ